MNHSKIIFSGLFLCFFLFSQVNAQTDLGVYVGISNSKLSGDGPPNGSYRYKRGLIASLHADIWLSEHVNLSLQPGFRTGGAVVAFKDTVLQENKDSVKLNLNFLSLPVIVKITSLQERVYFLGGLSFDYPLSLKADNGAEKIDKTEEVNGLNINAHFGLGYRIPVKSTNIYVELRYLQGLVNLSDQRNTENSYIPRVKSTAIQLITGWQIPLLNSER